MEIKYKRINKCICCNRQTMLFIWSTSRTFVPYQQKLSNLLSYTQKIEPKTTVLEAVSYGVPVCFGCFDKLKKGGKIVKY